MTSASVPAARPGLAPSYRYAHWGFLLALAAIVAGFWPSFFRSLSAGETWHTVHGVTATLWVVALAVQSYLISRGLVSWHRLVAGVALVLLIVLCVAALRMVAVMQSNTSMPPFLPPLLAFIDLASIGFLLLLVGLALGNLRRPPVHKRYMAASVLLALPPALGRLYVRVLVPDFMTALHGAFFTVELILLALIASDLRSRQRYAPYPLSLAFFVLVQVLMGPVSASGAWRAFTSWYASLPVFGG